MLGTLTITWIDHRETQHLEDLTLAEARFHTHQLRLANPTEWLSARWESYDPETKTVHLDSEWDSDDFSSWSDWADEEDENDYQQQTA